MAARVRVAARRSHGLAVIVLALALLPAVLLASRLEPRGVAARGAAGTGPSATGEAHGWQVLEPGLEFAELALPVSSPIGDSRLSVVRIDPAAFELRLLNASAPGQGGLFTARQWCQREGLVAAINASMYQLDFRTSVGLMRTASHVNNGRLNRRDRAVLAFDRLSNDVPPVDIIDLTCQDFPALRSKYGTLVQSIRMVSCAGKNTWQQQPRRWSAAAIGVDHQGRVLFMHCRSPYSTHDLIDGMLGLSLDLHKAMYVEGGPESQLHVRSGDFEVERVGSFESGFMESDGNTAAWPVPNVVAIARRSRPR